MIDFTEIQDGESWELFSRDFLEIYGMFIESSPARGADGGMDILVSENIKGFVGNYRFKWLVSCKHFASSNKSVTESDEPNILERVRSFEADGFIGFYSTIPSSGLHNRLTRLKNNREIKGFKVFDKGLIENHLIAGNYSPLLLAYLPSSYRDIKPIHLVLDDYLPLLCQVCGKDLLMKPYSDNTFGNILFARSKDGTTKYVYCTCIGECDKTLSRSLYEMEGLITSWNSLSDLTIPVEFLRYCIAIMNRIRENIDKYTDEAFRQEKDIIIKLAQRVLRYTTNHEKERVADLIRLSHLP